MDLAQLNQRISIVNAESQRINNERAINIGKRETLEKQLQDAISNYNSTFGVNIDINSLDAEIERVTKEKEAEVLNIESMLTLIKEGRFDEAQKKSGVAPQSVIDEPVVESSAQVVEKTVEQPVAPVVPVIKEVVTSPVVPVSTEAVSAIPTVPKAPVIEEMVTPPASPVVTPSIPNIEEPTPPVEAPPVIGKPPVAPNLGNTVTPPPTAPVTSFNAILSGSQFKPQGN